MQWAAFLTFLLGACYTPGPNIILAMNTARMFGYRRAIPLMSGMTCGLLVIMTAAAFSNLFIAGILPQALPWIRAAGCCYMLWFAWKIGFARTSDGNETDAGLEVPKFADGFALQFLNPKVILFGFSAFSIFIAPWTRSRPIFMLAALFVVFNCTLAFNLWAVFGHFQGKLLPSCSRAISVAMALLLAWYALSLSGLLELLKIS